MIDEIRVLAVIDTNKFAKLTFDREGVRLMVDDKKIYTHISDRDGRKKCLLFEERDMDWERMRLALHTVLKLSPEHCRSKAV